jgi:hypothetical protein
MIGLIAFFICCGILIVMAMKDKKRAERRGKDTE